MTYKWRFDYGVKYGLWLKADARQRREWNCALDLAFNKESGPKAAPSPTQDYLVSG